MKMFINYVFPFCTSIRRSIYEMIQRSEYKIKSIDSKIKSIESVQLYTSTLNTIFLL